MCRPQPARRTSLKDRSQSAPRWWGPSTGARPRTSPYVEVGSEVEADAPLCLVEVMKLYTTIYAKTRGRIARICAQEAELVEYDQILFVVDPA